MKKVQRTLAAVLAAMMLMALAGCSKGDVTKEVNSRFLVYFLNFPVFTGFPAHQHLCNLHFSLIFSLVRKL